jgi:hypothetical protein
MQVYSIRPTSFFANFTKYDLQSIVGNRSFSSAVASNEAVNGANAKVNWVAVDDIAHVAAAALYGNHAIETIYEEQKELHVRRNSHPDPAFTVVLDVTGGEDNTLSPADVAAVCTEILTGIINKTKDINHKEKDINKDHTVIETTVICNVAPLPSGFPGADSYAALFIFLRNGGFNASTNVVERVLGRPPKTFRDFLSTCLS